MSKIAISTGSLPRLEGKQFYELDSVVRMMRRFLKESKVDGFEFVLLPEWDSENAPLTPTSAPFECEKHTVDEVFEALQGHDFPILSVHANRDIGNYLCSLDETLKNKGVRLIDECINFTRKVGSRICVFHFWDAWKESLDLQYLKSVYDRFQAAYSDVEVSVENIPTKHLGGSPFHVMRCFRYKTLDLKWASMYNEFDAFANVLGEVDNVHIQGRLEAGQIVPTTGNLDVRHALTRIRVSGYSGLFAVELEGKPACGAVLAYLEKLKKLVSLKARFVAF